MITFNCNIRQIVVQSNTYNGWLMKIMEQQIGNCFILRHLRAATKTPQTISLGKYETRF